MSAGFLNCIGKDHNKVHDKVHNKVHNKVHDDKVHDDFICELYLFDEYLPVFFSEYGSQIQLTNRFLTLFANTVDKIRQKNPADI